MSYLIEWLQEDYWLGWEQIQEYIYTYTGHHIAVDELKKQAKELKKQGKVRSGYFFRESDGKLGGKGWFRIEK